MTATAGTMTESPENTTSYESLAFDELLSLRERLDSLIAERIGAEERELEARLARIKRLRQPPLAASPKSSVAGSDRRGKLPPLYRNPENPAQTWAGRGLKPRWLTQGLRSGKKLSHFLIADKK